jgi:ribosomal-protein-serine acetyltransferase
VRDITGAIAADDEVVLAPRNSSDATEMFAIVDADREDLRHWLGWIDATHSAADIRRYAVFVERQFAERAGFDYGIRFRGELVGSAGLHNLDWLSRSAQIGYWLRPGARGHGVMTRAVTALTTHSFLTLGLHRLEIRCVVENRNSRAVAERLGYRLEGILKESNVLHGRFRDLALYAMTSTIWTRARG